MNFYEYLAQLEAKGAPFAIATIVHASDNSPGRTSFKMCVTEDGTVYIMAVFTDALKVYRANMG